MRICYLTNVYPAPSHTTMRREIRALEALGVEVLRIAARRFQGPLVEPEDREEAIHTRYLSANPLLALWCVAAIALPHPGKFLTAIRDAICIGRASPRGILRHLLYIGEAAVLVRVARGADHVHANFSNATTIATLARVLGGPPISLRIHGPEEFVDVSDAEWVWKFQQSAFMSPISQFGSDKLRSLVPASYHSKIVVHRCGVDESLLASSNTNIPPPPENRLVCVARLEPRKGHAVLLNAIRRLLDEGLSIELVLVGDGSIREQLVKQSRDLGLLDNVTFRSWQSGEQVIDAIREAKALVLPSFAEGLPIVLMEALALGRAVIATRVAGNPELVIPGETGWLVESGDMDGLALAIRDAMTASDTQLKAMATAGRQLVHQHHRASQLMKGLLASIEAIHNIDAAMGKGTLPEVSVAEI